jgi:hypothetical protein
LHASPRRIALGAAPDDIAGVGRHRSELDARAAHHDAQADPPRIRKAAQIECRIMALGREARIKFPQKTRANVLRGLIQRRSTQCKHRDRGSKAGGHFPGRTARARIETNNNTGAAGQYRFMASRTNVGLQLGP